MTLMIPAVVESWFQGARSRWPSVQWTIERFYSHLGSDQPKHPEDLFLGGAAADRLDTAWGAIHVEVRPEVLRRVMRVSRRSDSPEDLWAEAVTRLIADDAEGAALADGRRQARIRRFRGVVPMPAFIAVIAKRIAVDRIRKLSRVSRGLDVKTAESMAVHGPQRSVQEEVVSMEMADRFAVQFAAAFRALTPTRQALLSLIYGHRMRKADAGRVLGMRDYAVSRELRAAMEHLRERLEAANPGTWTQAAVERWTEAWAELSESTEVGVRHDA
jgi:RNA polymerase sigma factor (sigma-70 family)